MTDEINIPFLPKRVEGCNWNYHLPGRPGEGEMPCYRDLEVPSTMAFWIPETTIPGELPEDVAIHVVSYYFNIKVEIGFGVSIEEAKMETRETKPYTGYRGQNGYWFGLTLTDEIRDYLNGEGLMVTRVGAVPPPPISVWIG